MYRKSNSEDHDRARATARARRRQRGWRLAAAAIEPRSGGEGSINAVKAVIAGAIDDAIGMPGGVTRLPVTPQRLREILRRR